jgi:cytochrome c biogenesis protein CcmG/thiol:disulfide interchange protein DsbE
MRHTARWVALAVGVVVAGLAVVLALQVGDDERQTQPRSELLGDPAPEFTVTTLDGEEVSLDSLRGRAVIVNFWNSWCTPCKQEEPALQRFYERHRDDADFVLLGIVRDDPEDAARDAVDDRGLEWPDGHRPSREGRPRLRHPRAAGDVRDHARRPRRRCPVRAGDGRPARSDAGGGPG